MEVRRRSGNLQREKRGGFHRPGNRGQVSRAGTRRGGVGETMGGRSAFERTEGSAVDGGRKTIVGRNQTEKEKVSRGTPTEEIRRRELVEDSSLESGPGRQTHDEKHERLVREYGIRRGQGGGKSAKSIERSKTRTVLLSIPRRRRRRRGRRHGRRGEKTNPLLALAFQIRRQKSRPNARERFRSQKRRSEHQSATLSRFGAKEIE